MNAARSSTRPQPEGARQLRATGTDLHTQTHTDKTDRDTDTRLGAQYVGDEASDEAEAVITKHGRRVEHHEAGIEPGQRGEVA